MKIKNIEISGLRGIKEQLELSLDSSKSVLIFGDNGSGKSSITDSFEWFYHDRVDHLSTEEIGRHGINALRNIFLPDDKDAFINIKFSNNQLSSKKILNSKLNCGLSNSNSNFESYIEESKQENLILRYRDLLRFIMYSKKEKLEEVSEIIGFSEVTKVRGILKKAVNDLKRDFRIKNFDGRISDQQRKIFDEVQQNIYTDEQFLKAVKELIEPLKLTIEINNKADIDKALELIKTPEDQENLRLKLSYNRLIGILNELPNSNKNIFTSYNDFYQKYIDISDDIDKFKKINLEKLLNEASQILEKNIYKDDMCPLCLQEKNREELIGELKERISKLALFKKEKDELDEFKDIAAAAIENVITKLKQALDEYCLMEKDNVETKKAIEKIKESYRNSLNQIKDISYLEKDKIKEMDELFAVDMQVFQQLISSLKDKRDTITPSKDELIKLINIKNAYAEIESIKKEKGVIEKQLHSMESAYCEFVNRQRNALSLFINTISEDINNLYLNMNSDENVDEIELVLSEKDDELTGLIIQFKYHGNIISPPDKYLSESHLNCLGICLFLSSVRAFNKVNKFFILDDVISSFDTNHRLRFANLLIEKFSDYQLFVFTHEKNWFDYLANIVKGTNWIINKTFYDPVKGTCIELPLFKLKERIDGKISKSDSSDLGNMIRRCLEKLLKQICCSTEVKVSFRFNDVNENRMSNELLFDLKGTLKKRKCELNEKRVLDKLLGSAFIGNRTSHDSSYTENISDLKAFYSDILELESLFYCENCRELISLKYYDSVEKNIRCKCGKTKYHWET